MKIRLPNFFLVLLSGYCFFSGSVQAKTYTEGSTNSSEIYATALSGFGQAEVRPQVTQVFTEAAAGERIIAGVEERESYQKLASPTQPFIIFIN